MRVRLGCLQFRGHLAAAVFKLVSQLFVFGFLPSRYCKHSPQQLPIGRNPQRAGLNFPEVARPVATPRIPLFPPRVSAENFRVEISLAAMNAFRAIMRDCQRFWSHGVEFG